MYRIPTVVVLIVLYCALLAGVFVGCSSEDAPTQPQPSQDSQAQQDDPQETPQPQPEQQTAAQPDPQPESQDQSAQPEQPKQSQPQQQTAEDGPDPSSDQQQAETTPESPDNRFILGGDRPATLHLPLHADEESRQEPRPLIVLLHGYSSNSDQANSYFRFTELIDEGNFGLISPDGTVDGIWNQFWNATPECCDLFDSGVDDVAYIKSLIAEAQSVANFDQVFVVGHSNGGFMAYRLACEDVPGLSGIVSLAGGAFANPADCRVPEPLSVLQIHGTKDDVVLYEGGRLPTHPDPEREPVPSAKKSLLRWVDRAGCELYADEQLAPIDADAAVPGAETSRVRFTEGCTDGAVMELWTIKGGGHIPIVWETDFSEHILAWLDDPRAEPALSAPEGERILGGDRPAILRFPTGDHAPRSRTLILLLHGYSSNAERADQFFGLSNYQDAYGFALLLPNGTEDSRGNQFWNATPGCCDFESSGVDDLGYLRSIVAEARTHADFDRVFAVGFSNGGFMAYRLACDGLDGLAAIVSLAGSSFGDVDRCAAAEPISVLQVHGNADLDIPYGGTLEYENGYPGAVELVQRWGARAGCDLDASEQLPRLDLSSTVDGAETNVQRLRTGCADGLTVELWTIEGANHFPYFQDDWPDHLTRWLFDGSQAN